MANEAEAAWAAGIFEGEGCFNSSRATSNDGRCRTARAAIKMTDKDVLERFAQIVGVGKVVTLPRSAKIPSHWKTQYEWKIQGQEDVGHVIDMFWPWLGIRRRERAIEVLERASMGRTSIPGVCPHGHVLEKLLPSGKRYCHRCARDRYRKRVGLSPDRFRTVES